MTEDINISKIDRIIEEIGRDAAAVIPILQGVQKEFKHLPDAALRRVCEITDITPAQIEGVASFFPRFRRTPVGKHMISVCDGTACHVKGSSAVYGSVLHELGIKEGDTDAAGLFTVQKVACLGCCTLAPAVQIDETTYGHVRTDTVSNMITDFLENEANRVPKKFQDRDDGISMGEVRVGLGSCCVAGGSAKIRDALEEELASLKCNVDIKPVGCVGMCHRTPLVEVVIPGEEPVLYAKVRPEDIPEIVERHFWSDSPFVKIRASVESWLKKVYTDEARNIPERYSIDVRDEPVTDFLGRQQHIATEHCGVLNPSDMEEYRRLDGFKALKITFFKSDPEWLVSEIEKSKLRGRGGGGFPTGRKWAAVQNAHGEKKYIICNGDEGDPGAFMDRMILESYPYRVIEGMIIASFAVGATEGVFYIRAEYPLAVKRVRQALVDCGDFLIGEVVAIAANLGAAHLEAIGVVLVTGHHAATGKAKLRLALHLLHILIGRVLHRRIDIPVAGIDLHKIQHGAQLPVGLAAQVLIAQQVKILDLVGLRGPQVQIVCHCPHTAAIVTHNKIKQADISTARRIVIDSHLGGLDPELPLEKL